LRAELKSLPFSWLRVSKRCSGCQLRDRALVWLFISSFVTMQRLFNLWRLTWLEKEPAGILADEWYEFGSRRWTVTERARAGGGTS